MVVTVVFMACSGIVSGVFLVGVFFSSPTEKVSVLNDSLGQEPMLSLCKIRKHNLGTLVFFPSITQSACNECPEGWWKRKSCVELLMKNLSL